MSNLKLSGNEAQGLELLTENERLNRNWYSTQETF